MNEGCATTHRDYLQAQRTTLAMLSQAIHSHGHPARAGDHIDLARELLRDRRTAGLAVQALVEVIDHLVHVWALAHREGGDPRPMDLLAELTWMSHCQGLTDAYLEYDGAPPWSVTAALLVNADADWPDGREGKWRT